MGLTKRVTSSPKAIPAAGAGATMLERLVQSGRQEAPLQATGTTLVHYWLWLAHASLAERRALLAGLAAAIGRGATTVRAWIPCILGECDEALVRAAARSYLRASLVSLETRELAIADAIDWVRRELALNRVVIFAALLDCADEAVLERLLPLRGQFREAEAEWIWQRFAKAGDDGVRAFIEEWRLTFG